MLQDYSKCEIICAVEANHKASSRGTGPGLPRCNILFFYICVDLMDCSRIELRKQFLESFLLLIWLTSNLFQVMRSPLSLYPDVW